jgi:replicative DNA helicase
MSEEPKMAEFEARRGRQRTKATRMVDRLPPHSIEAEQGVLGCCLLSQDVIGEAMLLFPSGADVFYDLRHRTIYSTLIEMFQAGDHVDTLTVVQRLRDRGQLDQVGGMAFLASLPEATGCALNLRYYADILTEKYILRKAITLCTSTAGAAFDCPPEVDNFLSDFERAALLIRQGVETGRGRADVSAVQQQLVSDYEAAMTSQTLMGISTGYSDLDRKLGGLTGQELIVIGGVPSSGKTTLALNIAVRAAHAGVTVSIMSLETSAKSLVHRIHCILGQVDGAAFLKGTALQGHFEKMSLGVNRTAAIRTRLMLHDTAMTDGQLFAAARQDYQAGARLFIVDYLQLLQTRGKDEFERVTNASKALKNLAKELNCPVIAVSSLSRPNEDRKPVLRDLRQSGQIDYDVNKALLLYCKDSTTDIHDVDCIIAKNKDGETGEVRFTFLASQFRFELRSPIDDDNIPPPPHND